MTIWFTADTHLGHANIIRHCARPFASVVEMDAAIATAWNAVVRADDDIYHLGDFSFRSASSPDTYLRRLSGRKHLIHGNHDTDQCKASPLWTSSQQFAEVKADGVRLVLFHYGMRTWRGSDAIHLYGHSHGRLPGDSQCCDVGVDAWAGFRPVSLAEIRRHLATLPARQPPEGLQT